MGLIEIHLAPYIQKAMALRDQEREIGGNAFRHSMATMDILMDYYHKDEEMDPVLLKAAVLHDLFEAFPDYNREEIRCLDADGPEVVRIVEILTHDKRVHKTKGEYLESILRSGDVRAMKVKVADRLQNLTDLHSGSINYDKMRRTLDDTVNYVMPIAKAIDPNMVRELEIMVNRRREEYKVLSFYDRLRKFLGFRKRPASS